MYSLAGGVFRLHPLPAPAQSHAMTKAEALSVCDELARLVPAGPVRDQKKAQRAKALVESLKEIPDLGSLARLMLTNITAKAEVHFGSADGFPGMAVQLQRSHLAGDIALLCTRLEEELQEEADYGPPRP